MNYLISNSTKEVFIRLNKNGIPETCNREKAQSFDKIKAKNILNNLPKQMKKFHFKLVTLSDNTEIIAQKEDIKEENIIISNTYKIPESILDWAERVRSCNNLAIDVMNRKDKLLQLLSNVDRELSNCLHEIELKKWKNGCEGYKAYKTLKLILERRRNIKDELSIVSFILNTNLESIATDKIENMVEHLKNRIFKVREVMEYDDL